MIMFCLCLSFCLPVYLSVCLSLCLSVCLSVCLCPSLCLSVSLSIFLSVCLSVCSSILFYLAGNADYLQISEELTLSAGNTRTCINLIIVPDITVETDESFMVRISSDDPSVQFTVTRAEVIISDSTCK